MIIMCLGTGFSSRPCFITVYKDHILMSDGDGTIYQLTKSGSYAKKVDVANIQGSRGLAVTANKDLIIVDTEGPIRVMTGDETISVIGDEIVSVIGDHGSAPWQLNNPRGVAVTRSGQIIVANFLNHNLLIYDLVKKIYIK